MQVFIRSSSFRTFALATEASDSVGSLYGRIESELGCDVEDQLLTFGGKVLTEKASLAMYDIQNASTLELVGRIPGGAQLGKAVKGRSKDKKGKKDKGEKSSEEKELQDRIKRMEINDYQKKLALIAKKQLQDWMEREQKNSRMNRLKIQNQWRKIMRLAKVENLRKDIEILSQNHERDVDRKDAIIQMLDRDLEEAEEQYQMALRAHLLNVDKLIDLQDARLLALENEFEQDLHAIETEFQVEKDKIVKQHTKEKNELLDIMQAVESEERDREAEAKQEHEQLREEIRNKNLEDINVLRITLDGNIEELEQHFETAHLNYLQNTDQRTQDFKYLTAKDQDLSKDIEIKIRKIERLQSSLTHWRTKITQNVKECAERNRALSEEKDAIAAHFQELKGRMNQFREHQAQRLTELAENARKGKRKIQDHLNLAERILKLGELARKFETEREKVLPFYASTATDEEEAEELKSNVTAMMQDQGSAKNSEQVEMMKAQPLEPYQPHGTDAQGVAVEEWKYLDVFWKRYNKVLLDQITIQREKERLTQENANLQAILKQYLDGISVNEDVMNTTNPLLVVNGRLRLNNVQQEHRGPNVVLEGNQIVHTYQMNR